MEIWGFVISVATCQPENRSEYIHIERVLVKGPDPSDPRYTLTHHPFIVIGSLY